MAHPRLSDGLNHPRRKVASEKLDGYMLGHDYAMWYPGASFWQVLSVASTLEYGYSSQELQPRDPIAEAMSFMRGYMCVCGQFSGEHDYSQALLDHSMQHSHFCVLVERSRILYQRSRTMDTTKAHVSRETYNTDFQTSPDGRMKGKEHMTTSNTKNTTAKDTLAAKRQQAKESPAPLQKSAGDYEENKSGYVNIVTLSGSLGRDTDYVADRENDPPAWEMAKNGLAVFNRDAKGKGSSKSTKWLDLIMFLNNGEGPGEDNTDAYVHFLNMEKGARVVITGWIGWRYWTDKLGVEREATVLHVLRIED